MANQNYVLLERIELADTAATVTFNNIPQTGYTDLKIVVSARGTRSNLSDDYYLTFNSSSTGFSYRQLYGYSGGAGAASGTSGFAGIMPAATGTASTFGIQEIYIPNYTSGNYKTFFMDSVDEINSSTDWQMDSVGQLWSNVSAISTISFYSYNGSFAVNSTFSLYGLAAVGTTPTIAPKASGGNITTDGTYWYHTFLASGNFVPQVGLTCDALVVAGGGGAGAGIGGGGGAGGLLGFTSQSISTATAVTVGAGGAGAAVYDGFNGSDSQVGSLTLVKGGGGGAGGNTGSPRTGLNGGSGGGGTASNVGAYGTSGGNPTSGQGYAGGASADSAGGGGGGAGGAGASGTTGLGGVGSSSYSSWGLATTTGQNVSGTVYYAGGGGGSWYPGTSSRAGGYGGGGSGGRYSNSAGTSGTVNTGGGAGGGDNAVYSGGSGIVIIRYPIA